MPQNIRALLLKENQNLFEKTGSGIFLKAFAKLKLMKERKYIWFKENSWCRGLALAASQNVRLRALLLKENENLFEKMGSSGIYVKTEKVRFLCQASKLTTNYQSSPTYSQEICS